PLQEGSRGIQGYVSRQDTELVKRLRAGGLIIVGKTNTPEFGCLPTTEPLLYGPTRNPWKPDLTPGGSSGGAAAAVAAGIVPLAHGNDAGGSIRIPASCCGVFGLKPTRGRNPLGPYFFDLGSGLVQEHGLTLSVRDSAALLDLTAGPDLGDAYAAPPQEKPFLENVGQVPRPLKIGFLTAVPEGWAGQTDLHPDCLEALLDAARLCETLGHTLEEVPPPQLAWPDFSRAYGGLFTSLAGYLKKYWEKELGKEITRDELEPLTGLFCEAGMKKTGSDYLALVEELQRFSRMIARWYHDGDFDLLLSPTLRVPPPPLGSFDFSIKNPQGWFEATESLVAFTRPQNVTGQPAMSVPLYWNDENIPIGVHLAARFGNEAVLFQLAGQLEEARPWARTTPPLHSDAME
ncbi:MAG: amidase, partial [Desulfobacterota bacterium]|nr:amidase [Thermodesulfobacteriota bacterium]